MIRDRRQRGAGAIETLLAMTLIMTLLLLFVQFGIWQFARASVRAAALDGARAGSSLDATAGDCQAAFERARSSLLGGPLGDGVGAPACTKGPELTTVTVDVNLDSSLAVMPGWSFTVTAVAQTERIDQ